MSFDFDLPHAGGTLANGAGIWPQSSPEQYVIFSIDEPRGLVSNGGRPATLYFDRGAEWDGRKYDAAGQDTGKRASRYLGIFRQASEKFAKASDAWTFDPSTGEYFIAE